MTSHVPQAHAPIAHKVRSNCRTKLHAILFLSRAKKLILRCHRNRLLYFSWFVGMEIFFFA